MCDRQEMEIETEGILRSELVLDLNKEDLEQKIFREAGAGYMMLNNFYPDNSRSSVCFLCLSES